jgi:hypothetical protein
MAAAPAAAAGSGAGGGGDRDGAVVLDLKSDVILQQGTSQQKTKCQSQRFWLAMATMTTCAKCGMDLRGGTDTKVQLFVTPTPVVCHGECARGYARDLRERGRKHLRLEGFDQKNDAKEIIWFRKVFGQIYSEIGALYGYQFVFYRDERFGYMTRFVQPDKPRRLILWYSKLNEDPTAPVPTRMGNNDPRVFHPRLWADGYFVTEIVTGHAAAMNLATLMPQSIRVDDATEVSYMTRVITTTVKKQSKTFIFTRVCGKNGCRYIPSAMQQPGDKMEQPWNLIMKALDQKLRAKWSSFKVTLRNVVFRTYAQLYVGDWLGVNMQWSHHDQSPLFVLKSRDGGMDCCNIWSCPEIYHVPTPALGPWPLFTAESDPRLHLRCHDVLRTSDAAKSAAPKT